MAHPRKQSPDNPRPDQDREQSPLDRERSSIADDREPRTGRDPMSSDDAVLDDPDLADDEDLDEDLGRSDR